MRQTSFIHAIFEDDASFLQQIKARDGIDVKSRFNIYKNNIFSSLIAALGLTFNVTKQLVGETFFSAMASRYIKKYPPTSRILAYYGKDFPQFIANFSPAKPLPYLADIALLEYLRVQCFHAKDSEIIDYQDLITLSQKEELAEYKLELVPSLYLFQSNYAAVSLWQAHQNEIKELQSINSEQAEYAVIFRENYQVGVMSIPQWLYCFLVELKQGKNLYQATLAIAVFNHANLAQMWQFLIENRLINRIIR